MLAALLTATALLTALTSGLLLLLTGLLLATLLLLAALLHITHFVVRHGELSFAEGFRALTIFCRPSWFPSEQNARGSNAGTMM